MTTRRLALPLLVLAGCAAQSAPQAPAPAWEPLSVATADYVRLAEGPCFGACPVYELTLYEGGQFVLMGQRFVEGAEARPGEASLEEAKAILLSARFDELPDDITMDNPEECPNPATDLATAEITIGDAEGYYRTVRYYQGCFHSVAESMLRQLRSVMLVSELVRAAAPGELEAEEQAPAEAEPEE